MNVAVVSYRTDPISKPNLCGSASILHNPPIDIELRKFPNTDI